VINLGKFYDLMKDKGVTSIRELSDETKIPYTTLHYMLNGHDLYVGNAVELAKFFGVPVDYFINKSYRVVSFTNDKVFYFPTSNLIEATALYVM